MEKKTMTLNLSISEMSELEEIADRKECTKTAVIRQALKLYQFVDDRLAKGERLFVKSKKSESDLELTIL